MSTETRRVGRPSKYNAEMQAQADDYVLNWSERDNVPSRAGLCCWLGIVRSTSFEWEAAYPEFSDTVKAVDVLQEHILLNKGVTGEFNAPIAKLLLNAHGYSDRQSVDHTTAGESLNRPATAEAALAAFAQHNADD